MVRLGCCLCGRRGKNINDLTVPIATITPQPIVLGTAEAVSEGSGSTSAGYCDACYLVADIAAVVWYSEVFINTVATGQHPNELDISHS